MSGAPGPDHLLLPNGARLGRAGETIAAGGAPAYYESHGQGPPLLLLHGGAATIESFHKLVPALMRSRRVILPERRGHGRTPDTDAPYTYAGFAQETAAFMDALGLGGCDVVGWSDGGIIALYLALARPELVGRMVLIGACFHLLGVTRWFLDLVLGCAGLDEVLPPEDLELLRAAAPGGAGAVPGALAKVRRLWLTGPTMDPAQLAAIAAPTLVTMGERDVVTLEHSAELARGLADGHLAVIPGSDHYTPLNKPGLLLALIEDFLGPGQGG